MIRDIPPLAVEGVDPWEKVQIDPVTRRLAEHAAAASGLAVEEWLERAIRRACPSAFRSASVTIPTAPVVTPTFAAPPRPVMSSPAPAATQAQPPEIEASLAALLAMTRQRQQPQPAPVQPAPNPAQTEARHAPVELPPAPPPMPAVAPVVRQTAARPAPAPVAPVPPPAAPVAEAPAALRRAPTIAERLAQQHLDETEEEDTPSFLHENDAQDERDWQDEDDRADAPRMLADDEEPAAKPEKKKFKLWASRDEYDFEEAEADSRR